MTTDGVIYQRIRLISHKIFFKGILLVLFTVTLPLSLLGFVVYSLLWSPFIFGFSKAAGFYQYVSYRIAIANAGISPELAKEINEQQNKQGDTNGKSRRNKNRK